MSGLDTESYFSSEAQETFMPDARVYTVEPTISLGKGAEGTYLGRLGHEAIVAWDTPSGEPYRSGAPFRAIRNLGKLDRKDLVAIHIAWDELVSYVETTGDEGSLDDEEMPNGKLQFAIERLAGILKRHGVAV